MEIQEINDYNRRCPEFLGWKNMGMKNLEMWVSQKFQSGINTDELKFHSDWNWIMEMVEAIEKLKYLVVIQSNFCQIQEIGIKENNFNPLIIASSHGNSKKKAAVQAINQFLIWYNNEQRT